MQKILITGGHHNSALPLIDHIAQNFPNQYKIFWVGKKYMPNKKDLTPEYIEVTKRDVQFFNIITGKFFRTKSIWYLHKVISNLLLIPVGFLQAVIIILFVRPNIVVSFGGYIAVPIAYVSYIFGIKRIFTHEQTAVIGLANTLISKVCKKILVAWPTQFYTNIKNIDTTKLVYVGLPVKNIDIIIKSPDLNIDKKKPVMLVTGGKLGSDFVNGVIKSNLQFILQNTNLIWATGKLDGEFSPDQMFEYLTKNGLDASNLLIKSYFFEVEMANILKITDFAVSRAGAHTIYEYLVCKIPCILIPIPTTSNNEQIQNANILESFGLAKVIDQNSYKNDDFISSLTFLIKNHQNIRNNIDHIKLPSNPQKLITDIIL